MPVFALYIGALYSILLWIMVETARNFHYPIYVSISIHLFSWVMQIAGHVFYEKRAPAFMDNLFQAFVLAPFFVFLEFLFMFGYRRDLQLAIDGAVEKNLENLKRKGKKLK